MECRKQLKKSKEFLNEIRNDNEYEFIPILLLCGTSNSSIIDSAFLAGTDKFLAKPATSAEIKDAILKMIDTLQLLKILGILWGFYLQELIKQNFQIELQN